MVLFRKYYILQPWKFIASFNRVYHFLVLQWSGVPGITQMGQDQGILIPLENVNIRFCLKWPKWIFIVVVFFIQWICGVPSRHLLVQTQLLKHQNNVWNLFKVNNKDTKTTSFPAVSIGFLWKNFNFFFFCQIIQNFEGFRWRCSFQCFELIKLVF